MISQTSAGDLGLTSIQDAITRQVWVQDFRLSGLRFWGFGFTV